MRSLPADIALASAPRVLVVTGPVHTGKTTRLSQWIQSRRAAGDPVAGVTAPVIAGDRHLCLLDWEESAPECLSLRSRGDRLRGESRTISIGPHTFSAEVFARARSHLDALAEGRPVGDNAVAAGPVGGGLVGSGARLIVVDEVGPLELRGEGLEPAVSGLVSRLVSGPVSQTRLHLLLVIRDRVFERALSHYDIGDIAGVLAI